MVLVVTGVGFLIHVYSVGYMHDDAGFARYFAYLNLFTTAMLILVLADNLLLLFVGWEGVGLCSYLLIGFWYDKDENAAAGKKAFIVNRIGDAGFLLGLFLLVWTLGRQGVWTVDFAEIERHRTCCATRPSGRGPCRSSSASCCSSARPASRHRSPLRLAARRHGGPDAGLRADPRRHHGHRRRLHGRAPARALRARARRR